MESLTSAARMVARGARWLGPAFCHGLAGTIDFLIDVDRYTTGHPYRTDLENLVTLLTTYAVQEHRNTVMWSDTAGCTTADFMVGYSGPLVSLIRYTSPTFVPSPLALEVR